MSNFEQGLYNKHEHDFVEWSGERLQSRINELHENNRLVGYTGERKRQVEAEMTHIAFEMAERLRESREQEIDSAWAEWRGRDGIIERLEQ